MYPTALKMNGRKTLLRLIKKLIALIKCLILEKLINKFTLSTSQLWLKYGNNIQILKIFLR